MDGSRSKREPGPALLIVDMINDFCFDSGDELFRNTLPVAKVICGLREELSAQKVPVIYVNDNFRHWHDSFATTISAVKQNSEHGRAIVDLLEPREEDYYILKPHRSGFYKTPLGLLLDELAVDTVIVTGITTDMCVLFTANDAHMRGLKVFVPSDCCAAIKHEFHEQALDLLARSVDAIVSPSRDLGALLSGRAKKGTKVVS